MTDQQEKYLQIKKLPFCKHCGKTGQVTATDKNTKVSYAFRCCECECANILNLSKAFVPWNDNMSDKFELFKF
jgi:hypothetical protein